VRNDIGNYTLNIKPGTFKNAPSCVGNAIASVEAYVIFLDSSAADTVNFILITGRTALNVDKAFHILCTGKVN
jgi:hypothetical protein